MTMQLHSPSFSQANEIPREHTCDDLGVSPDLRWSGVPGGTQSLALIMKDIDNVTGEHVHWILYDIPATLDELPAGIQGVGVTGRNDFSVREYRGPCPPATHPPHRYVFELHALDVETLGLPEGCDRQTLEQAMEGHVLQTATLQATYETEAPPIYSAGSKSTDAGD